MHNFVQLKTLTHHAYLFIGAKVHEIIEFLEHRHGIRSKGNPDFYHEKHDVFGIDESRKLKDLHIAKAFEEVGKRIFIIETPSMTHEAQNSLLKIFEEPHENSHFFLVMPSAEALLPTLRSRLFIIINKEESNEDIIKQAENFLKLNKKDKVAFVDDLAERISDEKATKLDAQEFLAGLEFVLYQKEGKDLDKSKEKFEAILKARDYMNDRSSSVKQLLEYVALSL